MSAAVAEVRARWSRGQRAKNDVIYALVVVALAVARSLPRSALVAVGRALGALAWVLAPSVRALSIANVSRAFPERSPAGARALARRAYDELGALLGDTIALLRADEPVRLSFAPGAREVLDAARACGRGVVLITAHLGPWERLAAALVAEGFPLTTPVRVSYDPRLEDLLHAPLRRSRGVRALDRDAPGTPRALLRALRANEIAGFLVDLNTRVAAAPLPFFGAPAWTPTGPARLALRTGAPVVAAFATREGIVVEQVRGAAERARPTEEEVLSLTRAMTEHVERAIAREPERWIWMHDRWGARRQPIGETALVATT
ncbi:MAG: lysophospholipid acyltransferase family protein [Deltaproteobacteria bacterium]|nr:lysophospholipid acyltransferase family protein [Deltaproteobacteria bacterium]